MLLQDKVKELLSTFRKFHPITYNHYLTETIQKKREKRLEAEVAGKLQAFFGEKDSQPVENFQAKKVQIKRLVSALSTRNEAGMDRYACLEVLDCMEAYYKV